MKRCRARVCQRNPLAGLLTTLAAVLTLFAWPATRVHEATAEHAVCAEHGEVVDVGAGDAHGPTSEEGERWRAQEEHEDEHGHCPFLLLGQPGDGPREAQPPCSLRVERARATNPGSEVRLASVPLLCLAPKQSPPV